MKDNILKDAIKEFGQDAQFEVAIEECSEFILAAQKFKRFNQNPDTLKTDITEVTHNVVDEIADVMIMMRQVSIIFGEGAVERRIEYKLERLKKFLYVQKELANQTEMFK